MGTDIGSRVGILVGARDDTAVTGDMIGMSNGAGKINGDRIGYNTGTNGGSIGAEMIGAIIGVGKETGRGPGIGTGNATCIGTGRATGIEAGSATGVEAGIDTGIGIATGVGTFKRDFTGRKLGD